MQKLCKILIENNTEENANQEQWTYKYQYRNTIITLEISWGKEDLIISNK